jgi:NitT/TauT family transport system permease protein
MGSCAGRFHGAAPRRHGRRSASRRPPRGPWPAAHGSSAPSRFPKITLYPVILLVFGLGLSAKVAFGALHGLFPVALFALGALRNTSPVLVKTARVLRLSPLETARTVLLPAALPEILTGLRIGFSTTLLGTLIGELFASDRGIGFILVRAMEAHKVDDIMALTLLLFAFAAAGNMLLLALERRAQRR